MNNRKNRALIKNDRLFIELLETKRSDFISKIKQVRSDFKLGKLDKISRWADYFVNNNEDVAWDLLQQNIDKVTLQSTNFLKLLNKEASNKFNRQIQAILDANKLGHEWFSSITHFVVTGFFMPPAKNLYIQVNNKNKEVIIGLNSQTTFSDIEESWHEMQNAQKKIFGNTKKRNLNKSWMNNIKSYAKYQKMKSKKQTFDYDEPSYYMNDEDIATRVLPEDASIETIKKKKNVIKQLRSRLLRRHN